MEPPRHYLLPLFAAFVGVGILALMDAQMKSASLATGVFTASLLRSALAACLIGPVWLARKKAWPQRPVMRLHVERGVISALMALTFFYALTKLPLAEAIAISFIAPLVALYFAHIFLGEQIRRRAIGASVLGLVGTLVIISARLGQVEAEEGVLLGLASLFVSAMLYAYNFVVIRKQSQVADPVEVATFHSGVGALVHLIAAPFLFVLPGAGAMITIAGAAILTVAGSIAIAWAYARAEAQVLVPMEYSGFLWASLFGWLFFREAVTMPTFIGAALIVLACWIAAPRAKRGGNTEVSSV
ncbi:DMT family transporter [Aurantiacibacter rhizosphaerae]|uniref:EamA family transporter n=1 Tax=Aurantiacibacter rhizosphaerae TaxID=2691582 RepID=A0A844XBS1_9SPHN|nr:DMT family transporter [Aurantiacibacter rhizosphaerae]MWV27068.1 EamA family transporter [Aurantiacibacter rhizosphaerae]